MVCVTEARVEDIISLHNQITELETATAESFAKRLEGKNYLCLLAQENGKKLGYVIAYPLDENRLYCWVGGVLAGGRGKGIYSQLAQKREDWAKKKGFKILQLKTRNKFKGMRSWLVKNGFDCIGFEERETVDENRLLFEKTLKG